MENVVEEGCEGGEGGYEVGVGGPFEGVDSAVACLTGYDDSAGCEPIDGSAAGIDLDTECDESEEGEDGVAGDDDLQREGVGHEVRHDEGEGEHADEDDIEDGAGDVLERDEGCAESHDLVVLGVLEGVTGLVGSHGGSGYGAGVVDLGAEVDGAVGGVVEIGESAVDGLDADIVYAILSEHHLGHLGTGIGDGDVAVFLELALKSAADNPAEKGKGAKNYPKCHKVLCFG